VKKIIGKEKKEAREMTVKKIRELGRPSYKLFWQNTGNSWDPESIRN